MGKLRGTLIALYVASAAVACGGSKPKVAAPPAAPAAKPSAEAAPDLSPVSAPADLIVVGRLKQPGPLLDVLSDWAHLPLDVRQILGKEVPGSEAVIKLDAPIDVAVVLNPKQALTPRPPLAAISVGLRSFSGAVAFARSQGETLRLLQAGVYGIGEEPSRCAIARSLGAAEARLVCGNKERGLATLLPYMTRGMPRESFGDADLHLELRGDPIRIRYGRDLRQLKSLVPVALNQLALDVPRFDRAVGDALHAVADEAGAFVEDFRDLTFDARLAQDRGYAELTSTMRFRSQTSWIAQGALERTPAPAPDVFWRLPKDASSASFSNPPNQKRYDGIRRTLAELADALLEYEKAPRASRDRVGAMLNEAFRFEVPWAGANGQLADAENTASMSRPELDRERLRQRLGWYVGIAPGKAEPWIADFQKLTAVYNDAALRRLLEKRAKTKVNAWPTLRKRAASPKLPKAVAFELTLPGTMFDESPDLLSYSDPSTGRAHMRPLKRAQPKPAKAKPLSVVFVIAPDGDRTWFGMSADDKGLVDRMSRLRTAATADTLAGRDGLTDLTGSPSLAGGFVTMAAIGAGASEAGLTNGSRARVLGMLPHHGETPIPFLVTSRREDQGAVTWTGRVPKAAFEDFGALVVAEVSDFAKSGSAPRLRAPTMPGPR